MQNIRDAVLAGAAVSPTQTTIIGASADVVINRDFSVSIRSTSNVRRTYDEAIASFLGLDFFASDNESDVLVMNRPGSGIRGLFDLDYTVFGLWIESDTGEVIGSIFPIIDAAPFIIGVPTPDGQMPTSGTGRYRGFLIGVEATGNVGQDFVGGEFTASADFGAGVMNVRADLLDSETNAWGTLTMEGLRIRGSGFSGDGVRSSRGHGGSASGMFTGPGADEVGGTFRMTGPSTVSGAFAGPRD